MTPSAAGKGDDCRIGDFNIYRDNYDRIFGKNNSAPKEDSCGLTDEEFEAFIEKRREELSETQLLNMNIVSTDNSGAEFNKLAKEVADKHWDSAKKSGNI